MNDDLKSRLEAIDADCESTAKKELEQLLESTQAAGGASRGPSPQAAEAIWLKLIARKESEFIQEIMKASKEQSTGQAITSRTTRDTEVESAETLTKAMFAEERYLERMRDFYREVNNEAVSPEPSPAQAKRLDLIDATYRAGIKDALQRARRNVLAELKLNLHKAREDKGFRSQWQQYSTLSPLRSIGIIILLSLTSYLIAFIIASDAFRALLERFGWSTGTGM